MRDFVFLAVVVLAVGSASTTQADNLAGTKISGKEIENVWRFCSVSGRATAAILVCFREQTDKIALGKQAQQNNRAMEALTRSEMKDVQ